MEHPNVVNIQNCGINLGAGNIQVGNNLTIINNPSPSEISTATSKTPFRFNIPTPTRHFKGRKKTMENIREYFSTLSPQAVDCWERIVAIVGLGGMGKTETAYKLAADNKTTFPNVAWINAETESSLLTSFLELSKHLKINRDKADLDLVKEVYRQLDQQDYGSVLFIFDNAIRLSWDEEEFGIMEYLPTNDLPNQRFPYVLITTQTHDWERGIKTFQVDELSEEESLEFFRSCFQIESCECDDLFKKLHKLLEGYPLVMNLAASQFDYSPKKDSVYRLQQQINNYIDKLGKEQTKFLNEKMNRAWPTKYQKTLSNVWQLTFERIQQEENGREALELLQLMSYLHVPIESEDVVKMLSLSSDCPHPPKKHWQFRVKELFRLLKRFYTVRILYLHSDNDYEFNCYLGIHRLVQLVVNQQMDSSKVLERVLFSLASDYKFIRSVNASAFEEAFHRNQLSHRALPFVGILACHGLPAACKVVETRKTETKAAATIWRLYDLERGMKASNENSIQVLRQLLEVTKSEEQTRDRYFFGGITIRLLTDWFYLKHTRHDGTEVSGYFNLESLEGVEDLVAELILSVLSIQDSICEYIACAGNRETRDPALSYLTAKLTKAFVCLGRSNPTLTVDVIADTWFALIPRLRSFKSDWMKDWTGFWLHFWGPILEAFHSPDASRSRIAALRTCLWNRGLAKELIQVFEFLSRCFNHIVLPHFPFSMILNVLDVCMDGMDLRNELVHQVISSFCQMVTNIETGFISTDYSDVPSKWICFVVELCLVWIKLFLMDGNPPSQKLVKALSGLKFLDWMDRRPKLDDCNRPIFREWLLYVPGKYRSEYFPQFIQAYSSSDIETIQKLVNVCRRVTEDLKDQ